MHLDDRDAHIFTVFVDGRKNKGREREKREAMYIACTYIFYDHQQLCRQKNGGTK